MGDGIKTSALKSHRTRACTFQIPGQPKGKARHRTTRTGQTYTPTKTKTYERSIGLCYLQAAGDRTPITGPFTLTITAVFLIPPSWPHWKADAAQLGTIMPTGKPDLDNVAKAVLDGLNGIAYVDDSQLCQLQVSSRYQGADDEVGLQVEVAPIAGHHHTITRSELQG